MTEAALQDLSADVHMLLAYPMPAVVAGHVAGRSRPMRIQPPPKLIDQSVYSKI